MKVLYTIVLGSINSWNLHFAIKTIRVRMSEFVLWQFKRGLADLKD